MEIICKTKIFSGHFFFDEKKAFLVEFLHARMSIQRTCTSFYRGLHPKYTRQVIAFYRSFSLFCFFASFMAFTHTLYEYRSWRYFDYLLTHVPLRKINWLPTTKTIFMQVTIVSIAYLRFRRMLLLSSQEFIYVLYIICARYLMFFARAREPIIHWWTTEQLQRKE